MIGVIKLNSRKHVFHMPLPGHTQTVTVNLLYNNGWGESVTILEVHGAHKNNVKVRIAACSASSLSLVIVLKC